MAEGQIELQDQQALAARATGSRPAPPRKDLGDPDKLRKDYDASVKALDGVPENAPNYLQLREAKKAAFAKWFAADNQAKQDEKRQAKEEATTPPPAAQSARAVTGTVRASTRPQA